jgi:hypothetical protein
MSSEHPANAASCLSEYLLQYGSTIERMGEILMAVSDILGIGVMVIAYGATWILLLRSLMIVKIIDKEELKHAPQIKARLRAAKRPPGTDR